MSKMVSECDTRNGENTRGDVIVMGEGGGESKEGCFFVSVIREVRIELRP